jgi:hypothetical protein
MKRMHYMLVTLALLAFVAVGQLEAAYFTDVRLKVRKYVTIGTTLTVAGATTFGGALSANTTLAVADTLDANSDMDVAGPAKFNLGLTPSVVTADPCAATVHYPVGTIFYNGTSNYHCFCNGSNADIKCNDNTTACF